MMLSKQFRLLGAVLFSASMLVGCTGSESTTPVTPTSDVPVTVSDTTKKQTFGLTDSQVVFVFDEATQKDVLDAKGITDITKIVVRASFNGWAKSDTYMLTKSTTDVGIWYLALPTASVKVPGNSGQPEFKFYVTGTVASTAGVGTWMPVQASTPDGYKFGGDANHLVVFPGDNVDTIIANNAQSAAVKVLADFDLNTDAGKANISNYRLVPGTTKLFRSYHPFKKSRPAMDTENTRVTLVDQYIESTGIKSIITLSGQETADSGQGEAITPYIQSIIDNNHNLFLDIQYNMVYFTSDSADFGNTVKSVVTFVTDPANEAPMLVHCRLGTDRTGVISATLAALVGASWTDIAADYQKSNNMSMNEFRDYKLLQYSFERMLGLSAGTIGTVNLKAKMAEHFVTGGYLTQPQIDALAAKLQ